LLLRNKKYKPEVPEGTKSFLERENIETKEDKLHKLARNGYTPN